jgi:UPF0176 protein
MQSIEIPSIKVDKMMMPKILNSAAYKFIDLKDLPDLRDQLKALCAKLQLKGTILLSPEGINFMLAGTIAAMQSLKDYFAQDVRFNDLAFKDSYSAEQPFNRMLVKIKKETISIRMPHIRPAEQPAPYIMPQQLKQWLDAGKDFLLLDTRNDYEIRLGTFTNAKHLNIKHFSDFPQALQTLDESLKEKTIVTCCTGGIRCEKAALVMQEQGFKEVYQLHNGILNYFAECGDAHYQGECFVYDRRVALNAKLEETGTTQCFACLSPVTVEEQQLSSYQVGSSCPNCVSE